MHDNRTDSRGRATAPDDQQAVTITTTRRGLEIIRSTMLRDLEELLKNAAEEVNDIASQADSFSTFNAHDARSHVEWIVQSVKVLDDLGWARETGWMGYRP